MNYDFTGHFAVIGSKVFEVGTFIPDLNAWDLIKDGCRVMTVRADVLLSIASFRLPKQAA